MADNYLKKISQAAKSGEPVDEQTALRVLNASTEALPSILAATAALRRQVFGERVHLCSILNAKSGACGEDCAFCAQSAKHHTDAKTFPMQSEEEIGATYVENSALPIGHFGVVTSGGALSDNDLQTIKKGISKGEHSGTRWCASLGCLDKEQLLELQAAGLTRFHHNLETAGSYFPSICTTHTYDERLATVRGAKEIGMEVCCGGILGMGESLEQRVEFAFTLQKEKIDAIPLNFLIPVDGTCMADRDPMKPLEILRAIAMFRLVNPRAEIKICAGRLLLRDLQSMIFQAGATGMMIGPLLTIAGRDVETDLQMLKDLELDYAF
ncbi:MAG: biotin synthase BioB [Lentisphaeria bacterium]